MVRSTNEDLHLEDLREEHFPESEDRRWPREHGAGWFKAPRALPVLLQVLKEKDVAGHKRGNLGPTYLELFSRVREQGFITLDDPSEHARLVGYGRQRTWRDAIRRLAELGFIETKDSQGREFAYALLINPFIPVRRLFEEKKIQAPLWHLFYEKWSKARAPVPAKQAAETHSRGVKKSAAAKAGAATRPKRRRTKA